MLKKKKIISFFTLYIDEMKIRSSNFMKILNHHNIFLKVVYNFFCKKGI